MVDQEGGRPQVPATDTATTTKDSEFHAYFV